MREIKFRVWDKEISKMAGPVTLDYIINDNAFRTDNIEIMQYTGLKDKNGKEIYEGDLITWTTDKTPYEVIYDETRLQFLMRYTKYKDSIDTFIHFDSDDFEVIGNVYENPDLLIE